MGRPSTYSPELATEICLRIACGESLAAICRSDGMPGYRTVMTWLTLHEGFQQDYTLAREAQGDADADAVSDLAAKIEAGKLDPIAGRVVIDAKKWTAGKRKPFKYGDKTTVEHTGQIGLNIAQLTDDDLLAEIAQLAAQRILPPEVLQITSVTTLPPDDGSDLV